MERATSEIGLGETPEVEVEIEQEISPPPEAKLPKPFMALSELVIRAMVWLNGFAHLILGLALGGSVIFFILLFVVDIWQSVSEGNLAQGFLQGLGSLMLLWTVSALITAEIRYMRGHRLTVDTFVEVAIVVIVRKLITMPVQNKLPSPEEFIIWVTSAVLLGVMYVIVRYALTITYPDQEP